MFRVGNVWTNRLSTAKRHPNFSLQPFIPVLIDWSIELGCTERIDHVTVFQSILEYRLGHSYTDLFICISIA